MPLAQIDSIDAHRSIMTPAMPNWSDRTTSMAAVLQSRQIDVRAFVP